MLKALFSNRFFIGMLAFFVLCIVGSLLYQQHVERTIVSELEEMNERIKALIEKPNPQTTAETPVDETDTDGTSQSEPHDTPNNASEKMGSIMTPIPSGTVPDWASMPVDKLAAVIEAIERRHVAAPDGYYYKRKSEGRLLLNKNGYPILHKIGEPDFTVSKEIGFAPTREEYARYQFAQQELTEAKAIGDTAKVERLQGELQHMYNTFRGEIPTISYKFQTYDVHADIEALHKDAAARATRLRYEEYRKSGFEYLIPAEYQ